MQCTNCRFENMPGSARCARCDSLLEFQQVAVDVHPPRAKKWHKHFRGIFNATYGMRRRTEEARIRQRRALERHALPGEWTPALISRMTIPGLPQFAIRRPRRGHLFLWGWLAAGMVALLTCGSPLGQLALAAMFTLHVGSVYDAITTARRPFRTGLLIVGFIFAALALLIYIPSGRLIQVALRVYAVNVDFPPFHEGDSLIVYRLGQRQVGEVVMYDRGRAYDNLDRIEGHRRYVVQGLGMDRILAKGGDHVVATADGLTINGQPAEFKPLNPTTFPHFDVTVPAGSFLIWPSVAGNGEAVVAVSQQTMIIPPDRIEGRVVFETAPFAKWGPVR